MSGEERQVVSVTNGEAEIITVDTSEDLISIAQRRLDTVKRLIDLSLKITTPQDWMNQDGKPYLIHSGAEKVARLFGIKLSGISTTKEWAEDTKGRYYIYRTIGTAALPGRFDSIEALGTCSQRDAFFGRAKGELKDSSEIDETNIMKASYSNFVVNSITHLLGLRNITWDQLKSASVDVSKIQKIEYFKGGEKMSEAAVDVKAKLAEMLDRMSNGDKAVAGELLKKFSGWKGTDGSVHFVADIGKLSEKWLMATYGKAKTEYEKTAGGAVPTAK